METPQQTGGKRCMLPAGKTEAELGFVPKGTDPFFALLKLTPTTRNTLWITTDAKRTFHFEGKVESKVSDSPDPVVIFVGTFEIDYGTKTAKILADSTQTVTNHFRFAGLDIKLSGIEFDEPDTGGPESGEVHLQGDLQLPTEFSNKTIPIKGSTAGGADVKLSKAGGVEIDGKPHSVSGELSGVLISDPMNATIVAGNLQLDPEALVLNYDKTQKELRFNGTLKVPQMGTAKTDFRKVNEYFSVKPGSTAGTVTVTQSGKPNVAKAGIFSDWQLEDAGVYVRVPPTGDSGFSVTASGTLRTTIRRPR